MVPWSFLVHPDDAPLRQKKLDEHIAGGTSRYECEFRIRLPNGEYVWVVACGRAVFNAEGKAVRLVAGYTNINESKKAAQALQESAAQLKEAQQIAHVGSWIYDRRIGHVVCSDELLRTFGLDLCRTTILTTEFAEFIHPDDWAKIKINSKEAFAKGTRYEMETRIRTRRGMQRILQLRAEPRCTEKGHLAFIAGICMDITEHKQAELEVQKKTEEIRHMAYNDSLTGLPNRLALNDRLSQDIERARSVGSQGALFYIDLHNLKAINDAFGHSCGDQLVVMVSATLQAEAGVGSFVARLDGDEFVVLLPEKTNIEEIIGIVKNLSNDLSREYDVGEAQVHISASIGVALYPQDGDTAEEILKPILRCMESKGTACLLGVFSNRP